MNVSSQQRSQRIAAALGLVPAATIPLSVALRLDWPRAFLWLTSIALILLVLFLSRAWRQLGPLLLGIMAGLCGTIAYDLLRIVLSVLHLAHSPFRFIEMYGIVLVGDEKLGIPIGWIFHAWNGMMFGAFYVLFLKKRTLLRAIAWGMCLELVLVVTVPRLFVATITQEFLTVSVAGHLFYGMGLHFCDKLLARGRSGL